MNGREERERKYNIMINNNLKDKPCDVAGFNNFLKGNTSVSTRYAYINDVIRFLERYNKPSSELLYSDFLDYISEIEYKEDGTPTTSSYKIAVYSALKKFCEYLYITKKIPENYMLSIKRPKFTETQKTLKKREIGFLTKDEVDIMLKGAKEDIKNIKYSKEKIAAERDLLIVKLFLTTGIRCSAMQGLDVSDIDFETNQIFVTDKGDKVSCFELSAKIVKELKRWLLQRDELVEEYGLDTDALFITASESGRMSTKSIYRAAEKMDKYVKGKNITPHKLRATYGTMLYDETKDLIFVQRCMGHAKSETTTLYIRGKNNAKTKGSKIMSRRLGL